MKKAVIPAAVRVGIVAAALPIAGAPPISAQSCGTSGCSLESYGSCSIDNRCCQGSQCGIAYNEYYCGNGKYIDCLVCCYFA